MNELVEHLFRDEAGKMLAALTRILGVHNLALAEDVVQDTIVHALEAWKLGRVPSNPPAWLMAAARNRAIDLIRRERTRRRFAPDLEHLLGSEWTLATTVDACFQAHEIRDDQLRMMFSCCAPSLSPEAQVALILKTLCGFSVGELASAFLSTEAAVEKQLQRGRRALEEAGSLYEVSGQPRIRQRLDAVLQALYLLFNEGYQASRRERAVREDLCREAIRLGALLAEHPAAGVAKSHALVAMMCFHAARLPARVDDDGCLVLLEAQDRAKWDAELIAAGFRYLDASADGEEVSEYHFEAGIAGAHCAAPTFAATNWLQILLLYECLERVRPSPIVSLNRAIVVGQVHGAEAGLAALDAIDGRERLLEYSYYWAARGDFHRRAGAYTEAAAAFRRALAVTRNAAESRLLEARLAEVTS